MNDINLSQEFVANATSSTDDSPDVIGVPVPPSHITKVRADYRQAPPFIPNMKTRQISIKGGGMAMEYEFFNVVDEYAPILKERAISWDFQQPPGSLRYIIISMIQTMIKKSGIGLAANQCGLRYNIFVMGTGQYVEGIVNPEILHSYGEQLDQEGCLSYPGLFMKVKRAHRIDVKYWDMNGVEQNKTFEGLTARIFQHEFDHLQGIRFTDLVSPAKVMLAKQKVKSNLKKIQRYKDVHARQEMLHKARAEQEAPPQRPGLTILPSNTVAPTLPQALDDNIVFEISDATINTR